ncbi:GNAT family N-acetyltransferase [Pontibacter silvestris]|uniref:GNAT family N-acetyltransferase n=1 Tax=Pontibacter silvestris TaxID=2305183 RepID=A0ABW4X045_9BACT|nr:GNAT family protein [Pontibacter silvestris]MCC9135519.1 GNAT family N-acetyltransferase [Pontibacter silvestris]
MNFPSINFSSDIVLGNNLVQLRPFSPKDLEQLKSLAFDENIWHYMTNRISNMEELDTWGKAAVQDRQQQKRYTFVVVDKTTGKLAGSTSYGNISVRDSRLEIGWTWLGRSYQGSGLNRQCKFLLLQYAFEVLQFERVELKTDVLNTRSRKAILKIGATEEGVLRNHTLMQDGRRRDTIYYSILKPEWETLKLTVFKDLL